LATKRVKNEPRSCPIECARVRGGDTDHETYILRDGEETPLVSEDDSVYPAGKTFVMKDGDHRVQYLSESEPASDLPEPNFDEITKVHVRQWPRSPDPSEIEENDTPPQPRSPMRRRGRHNLAIHRRDTHAREPEQRGGHQRGRN
jgi:hypothetical protein